MKEFIESVDLAHVSGYITKEEAKELVRQHLRVNDLKISSK